MVAEHVVLVLVLFALALNLGLQLLQFELLAHQFLIVERALLDLLMQQQSQVVSILLGLDEPFFEDKDLFCHGLLS